MRNKKMDAKQVQRKSSGRQPVISPKTLNGFLLSLLHHELAEEFSFWPKRCAKITILL